MMYVVPHGDRLEEYQLPSNPTASPAPLTTLGFAKHLGAYLLSFSVVGALVIFWRSGRRRWTNDDS